MIEDGGLLGVSCFGSRFFALFHDTHLRMWTFVFLKFGIFSFNGLQQKA